MKSHNYGIVLFTAIYLHKNSVSVILLSICFILMSILLTESTINPKFVLYHLWLESLMDAHEQLLQVQN